MDVGLILTEKVGTGLELYSYLICTYESGISGAILFS
jgi:hypothetical protein